METSFQHFLKLYPPFLLINNYILISDNSAIFDVGVVSTGGVFSGGVNNLHGSFVAPSKDEKLKYYKLTSYRTSL